jgi:hypothetical protein
VDSFNLIDSSSEDQGWRVNLVNRLKLKIRISNENQDFLMHKPNHS